MISKNVPPTTSTATTAHVHKHSLISTTPMSSSVAAVVAAVDSAEGVDIPVSEISAVWAASGWAILPLSVQRSCSRRYLEGVVLAGWAVVDNSRDNRHHGEGSNSSSKRR